ncbi:MAG: hypothetical protein KC475_07155, partial [Cyanobacteria bacterium HKST-UBA03]|nr:hypothetical protein [Cyanobacteria bacterium HKST-UBA03]
MNMSQGQYQQIGGIPQDCGGGYGFPFDGCPVCGDPCGDCGDPYGDPYGGCGDAPCGMSPCGGGCGGGPWQQLMNMLQQLFGGGGFPSFGGGGFPSFGG